MLKEYYNIETKTLTLPYEFSEELKDLPLDTKIIIFERHYSKSEYSHFNQLVDELPNNLTRLTFGFSFNQLVDNLPNTLTHLTFGVCFNQLVDATCKNKIFTGAPKNNNVFDGDNLPENLTHLTFRNSFNQLVDNLPENLTHLTFGVCFNQLVEDKEIIKTKKNVSRTYIKKINKSLVIKGCYNIIKELFNGCLTSEKLKNISDNFVKFAYILPGQKKKRRAKTPFLKWYVKGHSNRSLLCKIIEAKLTNNTSKLNDNHMVLFNICTIKVNY